MSAGSMIVAPLLLHDRERVLEDFVRLRAVAGEMLARDADSRAAETVAIEGRRVVGERVAGARRGRVVARVDAGEHAKQNRRVANGARHWPGGVLAVRDRNDSRAADQAERRLDADERRC